MRTLASLGILIDDAAHQFALTPLGETLQAGAPGWQRLGVAWR